MENRTTSRFYFLRIIFDPIDHLWYVVAIYVSKSSFQRLAIKEKFIYNIIRKRNFTTVSIYYIYI